MIEKAQLLEALKRLEVLSEQGGNEEAHSNADGLLLEYINDKEITDAFLNIDRWYS